MAKLKITKTPTGGGQVVDSYVSPTLVNSTHVGGTGGSTSQSGFQIQPAVYITGGSQTTGSILFQKGAHKFRVTDGTYTSTCTLVNAQKSNLAVGQMSLQINTAYLTISNANAYVASGASTSAFVRYTATGPVTPYVGQNIVGLSTVTSPVTISAINGAGNVTVTYASQTFANVANSTANVVSYASRITNKFVYDFGNDSYTIDGENGTVSTYYTSGYNPNKYRYHLASPDSTFVQVNRA